MIYDKKKQLSNFIRWACLEFMVIGMKSYERTKYKETLDLVKSFGLLAKENK